ncbi:hypothetical protein LH716_001735 [Vibrio vulnificus]|nr:hypothetical protein [Vibrio vulnificus]EIY9459537.1 hypothetical protein [Vibrio vulnificus]
MTTANYSTCSVITCAHLTNVSIESREIPTTEWAVWFAEVSRIYQQTEEYKKKQRQHKAAIADCNIIKDDYDEENDVFYNRHHQERG